MNAVPFDLHRKDLPCVLAVLRIIAAYLDTARFPAATGHHLSFQHKRIVHGRRFFRCHQQVALRHGDVEQIWSIISSAWH